MFGLQNKMERFVRLGEKGSINEREPSISIIISKSINAIPIEWDYVTSPP